MDDVFKDDLSEFCAADLSKPACAATGSGIPKSLNAYTIHQLARKMRSKLAAIPNCFVTTDEAYGKLRSHCKEVENKESDPRGIAGVFPGTLDAIPIYSFKGKLEALMEGEKLEEAGKKVQYFL